MGSRANFPATRCGPSPDNRSNICGRFQSLKSAPTVAASLGSGVAVWAPAWRGGRHGARVSVAVRTVGAAVDVGAYEVGGGAAVLAGQAAFGVDASVAGGGTGVMLAVPTTGTSHEGKHQRLLR